MSENQLNASEMTLFLQSLKDEQCNNGEAPHCCRDITNLNCFDFFNSLTAGGHRWFFYHSVRQILPALVSVQIFNKESWAKRRGWENPSSPTLHCIEKPWICLSCLINTMCYEILFLFFLDFYFCIRFWVWTAEGYSIYWYILGNYTMR